MTQDSLLTGDLHWLIKVVHLLVGLGAVGQAESLAVRSLRRMLDPVDLCATLRCWPGGAKEGGRQLVLHGRHRAGR